MANYSDLLKDPRWQKLRLEVMNRDDFKCQKCGATDKTLHVHHQYYIKGHEPWDYSPLLLVTLCHECHSEEEYNKTQTDEFVSYLLMQPVLRYDIHRLLSHVACAISDNVKIGSPCQANRDKLHEIIALIDKTFTKERVKKDG